MGEGGAMFAPRNFWKERHTVPLLSSVLPSFAFSKVSVPCHPHLGNGEMDTYLVVVGFEFSI